MIKAALIKTTSMGSAISHPGLLHSCLPGHQGSILATAGAAQIWGA